jgi:N-ethylmaleimide reductase
MARTFFVDATRWLRARLHEGYLQKQIAAMQIGARRGAAARIKEKHFISAQYCGDVLLPIDSERITLKKEHVRDDCCACEHDIALPCAIHLAPGSFRNGGQSMSLLYSPTKLGPLALKNRLVMSPLTRNRAPGNVPNALMAEYYGQRAASAGLIITEGTSPSPNGLGYPRQPGIFSAAQVAGWKLATEAVHGKGTKIFIQLMHTGRIGHPNNLPAGAVVLGPSAIAAAGEMYTDADIKTALGEYVQAAKNAVAAGFEGIELHGANGYLLEQFIRPTSNRRTDAYGGPIENRARFVLDVVNGATAAIGKDKVGIRLSPYGIYNDLPLYPEIEADYTYLAHELNAAGLLYVHLVDHSAMGAPAVPQSIRDTFRKVFKGALILSGGYDAARAEADLEAGRADLIAVGRPLLANPDLIERWQTGAALNAPDMNTFYTPGAKGYTDYPLLAKKALPA